MTYGDSELDNRFEWFVGRTVRQSFLVPEAAPIIVVSYLLVRVLSLPIRWLKGLLTRQPK